jgi:hypothetical protein
MPKAYLELDLDFNPQGQLEVIQYVQNGDLVLIQKNLKDVVVDAIRYNSIPAGAMTLSDVSRVKDEDGELVRLKEILTECVVIINEALDKKE